MIIKNEHIKEAERLLINGNEFDSSERVPFIKNLNTCDLLAVPGSGKTTALQAKLYCLSKQLPFEDGSGILVLSHTNAAVEGIEKNLKSHCPNLFEYPNFIGTLQSFVNSFLANPSCEEIFGSYISINDNDIYENEVKKFYYSLKWSRRGVEPKNLINKLYGIVNAGQKVEFNEGCNKVIDFLRRFDYRYEDRKLKYNNRTILKFDSKNQNYYIRVEDWKKGLLSKGLLNYYDSYNLGNLYVDNHPEISNILQKRFKYVFIDEVQDLEKYQIDIIDKIFYEGESLSTIQRIGDINQSIFNSGKKVKVKADWEPRKQMYINGSNRLTPEIANVVNYFTLDRQQDDNGDPRFIVNGLRQLDNEIKSHIILFNDQTVGRLEGKFKDLIRNYTLQETKEGKKYGFKIIGWNARWDDNEDHDGKLRLENIFESYKKEANGKNETFDSLSKYMQLFDHDKNTLEAARKTILNSLIHILRLDSKTIQKRIRGNDVIRYYSKSEMIKSIQDEKNECDYDLFKNKLFTWSFDLAAKRNYEEVYNNIKVFVLSEFKEWFGLEISPKTIDFLGNQFDQLVQVDNTNSGQNNDDSLKVDIGTIHSAKGQTHCATMYIETSYYTYETEKARIKEALKREEHNFNLNSTFQKRGKEAMKMMYVGFSRPTHLLCFAAFKENVQNELEDLSNAGWEIIDLTIIE